MWRAVFAFVVAIVSHATALTVDYSTAKLPSSPPGVAVIDIAALSASSGESIFTITGPPSGDFVVITAGGAGCSPRAGGVVPGASPSFAVTIIEFSRVSVAGVEVCGGSLNALTVSYLTASQQALTVDVHDLTVEQQAVFNGLSATRCEVSVRSLHVTAGILTIFGVPDYSNITVKDVIVNSTAYTGEYLWALLVYADGDSSQLKDSNVTIHNATIVPNSRMTAGLSLTVFSGTAAEKPVPLGTIAITDSRVSWRALVSSMSSSATGLDINVNVGPSVRSVIIKNVSVVMNLTSEPNAPLQNVIGFFLSLAQPPLEGLDITGCDVSVALLRQLPAVVNDDAVCTAFGAIFDSPPIETEPSSSRSITVRDSSFAVETVESTSLQASRVFIIRSPGRFKSFRLLNTTLGHVHDGRWPTQYPPFLVSLAVEEAVLFNVSATCRYTHPNPFAGFRDGFSMFLLAGDVGRSVTVTEMSFLFETRSRNVHEEVMNAFALEALPSSADMPVTLVVNHCTLTADWSNMKLVYVNGNSTHSVTSLSVADCTSSCGVLSLVNELGQLQTLTITRVAISTLMCSNPYWLRGGDMLPSLTRLVLSHNSVMVLNAAPDLFMPTLTVVAAVIGSVVGPNASISVISNRVTVDPTAGIPSPPKLENVVLVSGYPIDAADGQAQLHVVDNVFIVQSPDDSMVALKWYVDRATYQLTNVRLVNIRTSTLGLLNITNNRLVCRAAALSTLMLYVFWENDVTTRSTLVMNANSFDGGSLATCGGFFVSSNSSGGVYDALVTNNCIEAYRYVVSFALSLPSKLMLLGFSTFFTPRTVPSGASFTLQNNTMIFRQVTGVDSRVNATNWWHPVSLIPMQVWAPHISLTIVMNNTIRFDNIATYSNTVMWSMGACSVQCFVAEHNRFSTTATNSPPSNTTSTVGVFATGASLSFRATAGLSRPSLCGRTSAYTITDNVFTVEGWVTITAVQLSAQDPFPGVGMAVDCSSTPPFGVLPGDALIDEPQISFNRNVIDASTLSLDDGHRVFGAAWGDPQEPRRPYPSVHVASYNNTIRVAASKHTSVAAFQLVAGVTLDSFRDCVQLYAPQGQLNELQLRDNAHATCIHAGSVVLLEPGNRFGRRLNISDAFITVNVANAAVGVCSAAGPGDATGLLLIENSFVRFEGSQGSQHVFRLRSIPTSSIVLRSSTVAFSSPERALVNFSVAENEMTADAFFASVTVQNTSVALIDAAGSTQYSAPLFQLLHASAIDSPRLIAACNYYAVLDATSGLANRGSQIPRGALVPDGLPTLLWQFAFQWCSESHTPSVSATSSDSLSVASRSTSYSAASDTRSSTDTWSRAVVEPLPVANPTTTLPGATQSTASAAAVVSGAAGSPGGAIFAGRIAALNSVAACGSSSSNDDVEPLDRVASPLGLVLGTSRIRYHAGAVLGNAVLLIAFAVLVVGFALLRRAYYLERSSQGKRDTPAGTRTPRAALAYARFPSLVVFPAMLLGPSILQSSIEVVARSTDRGLQAMAIVALVGLAVMTAATGKLLLSKSEFQAVFAAEDAATSATLEMDERCGDKVTRFFAPKGEWIDRGRKAGIDPYTDPAAFDEHPPFVRRFFLLFSDYDGQYPWYLLMELGVSWALAGIGAAAEQAAGTNCVTLAGVSAGLFGAYLAITSWLRPYESRLGLGFALATGGVQFASAVIAVVALGTDPDHDGDDDRQRLGDVSQALSIFTTIVVCLRTLYDVGQFVSAFVRRRVMKKLTSRFVLGLAGELLAASHSGCELPPLLTTPTPHPSLTALDPSSPSAHDTTFGPTKHRRPLQDPDAPSHTSPQRRRTREMTQVWAPSIRDGVVYEEELPTWIVPARHWKAPLPAGVPMHADVQQRPMPASSASMARYQRSGGRRQAQGEHSVEL
jgi:hypothetical protein